MRLPSRMGFQRKYGSRNGAYKAAIRSRDAFLPLMAAVSWSLSAWLSVSQLRDFLVGEHKIEEGWFEELLRTQILDFTGATKRVGAFIRAPHCPLDHFVVRMLRSKVPTWMLFPDGDTFDHPSTSTWKLLWLGKYIPSRSSILTAYKIECEHKQRLKQEALEQQRQADMARHQERVRAAEEYENMRLTMQAEDAGRRTVEREAQLDDWKQDNWNVSDGGTYDPPPQILPDPETSATPWDDKWLVWFEMRRKSHRDRQSLENPQDRKARENLEQRAQKKMKWGLNQGFPVYYWQSIASGRRRRTLVSRRRAFELINEYLKSQILFDGFRREYDVCSEFGALDRNIDEDFDEEPEPDESENNFRRTFVESVYAAQGTFAVYHMYLV